MAREACTPHKEKEMASNISSPCSVSPLSSSPNEPIPITPNMGNTSSSNQLNGSSTGPLAILWDIENCPVPRDVRPEDVAGNIRMAVCMHPIINGTVTVFSAYGDFNAFPRRLREGCQRTGVKLVDVPNGRKDAADKAILVDMFLFALDNRPPSSILLISGDVDFAPALHILGQRGYTVVLVIPSGVGISTALSNAGKFVWDWPSVAGGKGFIRTKAFIPRTPDTSGYHMNCNYGDKTDPQIEEEAIVYRGTSLSDSAHTRQMYHNNCSCVSREVFSNNTTVTPSLFPTWKCQSLPSGNSEAYVGVPNAPPDLAWVQPGDIQGLKGQIVRLLELHSGSLALYRVPSEYRRLYGRHLYMAEYGVCKLVNLLQKMEDAITVLGQGDKKLICLKNHFPSYGNVKGCCYSIPSMMKTGENIVMEENTAISSCANMASSSDDFTDDEGNVDPSLQADFEFDERLEGFKQEVEELLVCYSCPVLFTTFETLYEQRYKKLIDYRSFAVDGLEELIYKIRDVVKIKDRGSSSKVLVATSLLE